MNFLVNLASNKDEFRGERERESERKKEYATFTESVVEAEAENFCQHRESNLGPQFQLLCYFNVIFVT